MIEFRTPVTENGDSVTDFFQSLHIKACRHNYLCFPGKSQGFTQGIDHGRIAAGIAEDKAAVFFTGLQNEFSVIAMSIIDVPPVLRR